MSKPTFIAALLAPFVVPILALGLAGCSALNPTVLGDVNSRPPELPKREADKIDGDYKGEALLVAAVSPACPGSSDGRVEIGDQKLYFAYQPDILFVAPVRPDGSLYAVSGPSVLIGKLSHGELTFSVRTPVCESRYALRYVL